MTKILSDDFCLLRYAILFILDQDPGPDHALGPGLQPDRDREVDQEVQGGLKILLFIDLFCYLLIYRSILLFIDLLCYIFVHCIQSKVNHTMVSTNLSVT